MQIVSYRYIPALWSKSLVALAKTEGMIRLLSVIVHGKFDLLSGGITVPSAQSSCNVGMGL